MTRDECKQEVLTNLGQALGVSAGPGLDAPWASDSVDELLDVFYPGTEHEFSELDVAGLLMKVRLKWEAGRA